jgi:hypothetical protein
MSDPLTAAPTVRTETSIGSDAKAIFDHFRNYFICASILIAGLTAVRHPEWNTVGQFGQKIGLVVCGIAVLLALFNSALVVRFIWVEFAPLPVPGTGRKRGHNFRIFVLLMYVAIIYILIAVSVNLKVTGNEKQTAKAQAVLRWRGAFVASQART